MIMALIDEVKKIIDRWDPIELRSFAPDDEYESEIMAVCELVASIKEESKLSEGIYDIFLKVFGEDTFRKSKEECLRIAREIMDSLDT